MYITREYLFKRLSEVFTKEQAEVITDIICETSPWVKKPAELKEGQKEEEEKKEENKEEEKNSDKE